MHDRETGPLNEALDREIEQMLDVQPSPEYVARVRQRVESARPSRGCRWRLQSAAVAAVAVLAAVMWQAVAPRTGGTKDVSHADAHPSVRANEVSVPVLRSPGGTDGIVPSLTQPIQKAIELTGRGSRLRSDEIVIDVNDAAAFEQFVETMRSPQVLIADGDQVLAEAMVLQVPIQVNIPAIEIAPVEVQTQEGEE